MRRFYLQSISYIYHVLTWNKNHLYIFNILSLNAITVNHISPMKPLDHEKEKYCKFGSPVLENLLFESAVIEV